MESHPPEAIHEANQARARLRRAHGIPKRQIPDPRQPKRNVGAFMLYTKERFASGDFVGEPATVASKAITQEWKNLSDSQKQVRLSSLSSLPSLNSVPCVFWASSSIPWEQRIVY